MPAPSRPETPLRLVDDLNADVLLAEHGPALYALCRRLDPEPDDAFQDVWAHLLPRLHRYDPGRGAVRPWLLSVAHRRLVDRHRRRRTRRTEVLPEVAAPGPGADELVDRADRLARLEGAVARLPEGQRRVVVAHHIHGRALAVIAEDEGIAVGTVKSRLHRGRARLATLLETP